MATPLTTRQPRDPYRSRPGTCEDCGTRVSPTNWSGMRVHDGRWLCTVRGGNREESCHEKSIRLAVEDLQRERRMEVDIWASEPPGGLHALHESIHYDGKRLSHGTLGAGGTPPMKPRAVEYFNRRADDQEVPVVRDYFYVREVAELLGYTDQYVRDEIEAGRLAAYPKVPGKVKRIRPPALESYCTAVGYDAGHTREIMTRAYRLLPSGAA